MDCLQHSDILVYPFGELLCNHCEAFGLPVHKTGYINSACSQPCADLQGSCFSQVSLFCGDQKTLLTLQTTMQQHRAWPNETAVMPYNGLVLGQGGAPGVFYWVVQLQPDKVTGRARGYMLPPCTFTLLPLLVLSFIYFFEISCALHSKDSSALIFQIIIYKVSRKEKKIFREILNIRASWPNLFPVVLLVVDFMWRSHCCCLSSHV